jgi:Fe-S cluster assembly iron-binding protein IscA
MSQKTTCSGSASWAAAARASSDRFDLVSNAEPETILIERAGAKVLVDSLSLTYLAGSEIDYVDDLMSASLKINNPNSRSIPGALAPTAIG